jgi:hypothetical protein
MNNRRAALCAVAAVPLVALAIGRSIAQPVKRTLIGLLDASDRLEWWDAFRQQLRELGYTEGSSVSSIRVLRRENLNCARHGARAGPP